MEPSANVEMEARGGRDGWCSVRRWLLQRWATLSCRLDHKEFFPKREATLALSCLFVALTASAQSTTEYLPTTDAEKVADALRAAPTFITDGATIVDYPVSKGGEFRVLRQGSSLTVLINTMYYAPIFNCFVKEPRRWGLRPKDLSNTCR
jgi:hypothetical protein